MNPVDTFFAGSRSLHPQHIGMALRVRGSLDPGSLREHTGLPVGEHAAAPGRGWLDVAADLRTLPLREGGKDIQVASGHRPGEYVLLYRVHHALSDGMGVLATLQRWFSGAPPAPATPRRSASLAGLLRLGKDLGSTWLRHLSWPASRSALEGQSYVAGATVSDRVVRSIAQAQGVTRNDVYLTAFADAVRPLAEGPSPIRVCLPVSTRRHGEEAAPGNFIAAVRLNLPAHRATADQQLRAIARQTRRIRRYGVGESARLATSLLPSVVAGAAVRRMAHPACASLTLTHLPLDLYLPGAGSRVLDAAFLGALVEGHVLHGTVTTFADTARLTVVGDTCMDQGRSLPESWAAHVRALASSLAEEEPSAHHGETTDRPKKQTGR